MIAIPKTRFRIKEFLGLGWTMAPTKASTATLQKFDPSKIALRSLLMPKDNGAAVGEVLLARLEKRKQPGLDARVFQMLWDAQKLIPAAWKAKTVDSEGRAFDTNVFFPGTIFSDEKSRTLLYLRWHDAREWRFGIRWAGNGDFSASDVFAVLA